MNWRGEKNKENGDEDTKRHVGLVSVAHNVDMDPSFIVFPLNFRFHPQTHRINP